LDQRRGAAERDQKRGEGLRVLEPVPRIDDLLEFLVLDAFDGKQLFRPVVERVLECFLPQ
jgi:hypothetical protein